MGIFAIILAELAIDRAGRVGDDLAEIVEQAGRPGLAVVGEAADAVAGLTAQARNLVANLAHQPVGAGRAVAGGDEAARRGAVAIGRGGAADDMIGAFGQSGLTRGHKKSPLSLTGTLVSRQTPPRVMRSPGPGKLHDRRRADIRA